MKIKELTFRMNSDGKYVGAKKIDNNLTIFYVLFQGRNYWELSCSSNPKVNMENGLYYDCLQLHENFDDAKKELTRFVNTVSKNPSKYYPEEVTV
jgi:hypothetical protein